MSKPLPIRTDGDFGQFYTDPHDVRAVVTAYRAKYGVSYRAAWAAWFAWAFGSPRK